MKLFENASKTVVRTSRLSIFILIFVGTMSLVGVEDSLGVIIPQDRRIDWSPGIQGGIPYYPVGINVKDVPYNAVGNGITDDTAAIQAAINDCASGKAVYLPAGTYKITGTITMRSNVVLRGDGPNRTMIKDYRTAEGNSLYFQGGGNYDMGSRIPITDGYVKGSTSITVQDASTLTVNTYIAIYQDNDTAAGVTNYHYNSPSGSCIWCGDENGGNHCQGQINKITAKNGNTLTLEKPLYFTFKASLNPEVEEILSSKRIMSAGIEGLKIERVNPVGSYSENANIRMKSCMGCWIKNVESYNSMGGHVVLTLSYQSEIRDSYFHHGHSYASGRNYGVWFLGWNTDCLVENNKLERTRHSLIFEGGGSGNVIAYNYSKDPYESENPSWLSSDVATHGCHPYMNLFEGNIVSIVGLDNTFGSSSHNTLFRNHVTRTRDMGVTGGEWAVNIEANNYYENVVGNVLGTSQCGGKEGPLSTCGSNDVIWRLGCVAAGAEGPPGDYDNVNNTTLRHGNYDYVSNSTKWDPSISDHDLPNSYYLSSKPAFFGDLPWPSIGPDLNPMVGPLPAKKRFDDQFIKPLPPTNLRILDQSRPN